MIYCGYQGCGKTTYCKDHPDTTVDLDSSLFNKREEWEKQYVAIARILSDAGKQVFISAHQCVINYLMAQNIYFELLIPAQDPAAWRSRLEFRYNNNRTQPNMNALIDFDQNYAADMEFYAGLPCKKHYIYAKVITNIGDVLST